MQFTAWKTTGAKSGAMLWPEHGRQFSLWQLYYFCRNSYDFLRQLVIYHAYICAGNNGNGNGRGAPMTRPGLFRQRENAVVFLFGRYKYHFSRTVDVSSLRRDREKWNTNIFNCAGKIKNLFFCFFNLRANHRCGEGGDDDNDLELGVS